MPTYQYKCNNCGTKFDKFFKVHENAEEIICPNCNSHSAQKMISASFIASSSNGTSEANLPPCATGYCNSDSCSFN